jgi:hypothetical protein
MKCTMSRSTGLALLAFALPYSAATFAGIATFHISNRHGVTEVIRGVERA